jgi:protease-4
VGGEALYSRLRQIAEKKPIVAVMGEVATSAAYMTAIGSDHIVAHDGTLTGSIGVILQTADVTGLLDKVGIKPEAVKSSPLKAQPNPLEPFTPEAREATRKVVSDIYEMFVSMVQKRRGLSREQVDMVADGSVFTGRQAKEIGLVDILGGEREARAWLAEKHGIDQSLPVQDVQPRGPGQELRDMVGGFIGKAVLPERLTLDGLVSVWHPSH